MQDIKTYVIDAEAAAFFDKLPLTGKFFQSGDAFVVPFNGDPIIFTETIIGTYVVQARYPKVVGTLIKMFQWRKAPILGTRIQMQFGSADRVQECLGEAILSGFPYVWSLDTDRTPEITEESDPKEYIVIENIASPRTVPVL